MPQIKMFRLPDAFTFAAVAGSPLTVSVIGFVPPVYAVPATDGAAVESNAIQRPSGLADGFRSSALPLVIWKIVRVVVLMEKRWKFDSPLSFAEKTMSLEPIQHARPTDVNVFPRNVRPADSEIRFVAPGGVVDNVPDAGMLDAYKFQTLLGSSTDSPSVDFEKTIRLPTGFTTGNW
jgi:hypothetical protein